MAKVDPAPVMKSGFESRSPLNFLFKGKCMKKILLCAAIFLLSMGNILSQIKVTSTTSKNNEVCLAPLKCISIFLKFENVPYDEISSASFNLRNMTLLNIKKWKKISTGTFEVELLAQIDDPKRNSFVYVYGIGNQKVTNPDNVNEFALWLKSENK